MSQNPIRIGVLGAARIAPMALVWPAAKVAEVTVIAVAARDQARAQKFATKHKIQRVLPSYDALIAEPEIDAIYNPLPNSHHCDWTIRALQAGKHVLCEKPLAANAAEAEKMAAAASASGRVLMEAFHWRYHPLAQRVRDILDSGEIGRIRHVEADFCIPLWIPGDIRYRLDLAGGALMDTGCYAVSIVRFLAAAEPEVVRAQAKLSSPGVDRYMEAELRFPGDISGRITCSMFSAAVFRDRARVIGDKGDVSIFNPVAPHIYHRLTTTVNGRSRRERVPGDATYTHQLRAFAATVRDGTPIPTDAAHGVANMRAIDAIYRVAGLSPRAGS